FDGPLTFGFGRNFGPFKQPALTRGRDPQELMVCLEIPGLGRGAKVTTAYKFAPADVHPVADIEFPGKQPGGTPIKRRVVLKDRCCGISFSRPVLVPFETGNGNAKVRFHFPYGKVGKVSAATIDVLMAGDGQENE